ncbi:MAG TPA: hypothetical protein VFV65_03155 [Gemmatimonadales bacterium]|nr:hypothetical protein [Gemmatimonadales bacterium]
MMAPAAGRFLGRRGLPLLFWSVAVLTTAACPSHDTTEYTPPAESTARPQCPSGQQASGEGCVATPAE